MKQSRKITKPIGKPAPNPHQRILVVDDNEDLRRLNTEILTESGYQVDTAADGARAWDSLQVANYDLLLTDYSMPHVNGLNLIKKVRAAHIVIPVILVSGTVPAEELKHPGLHIEATLPRPYTLGELLASVRKILGAAPPLPAGPRRRSLNISPSPAKSPAKRKPTVK